ncbi:MAG: hypothetical protein ABI650_06585 [Dokdonella sp.]
MRSFVRPMLLIAILALLGACGNKAELVRPPATPDAPTPAAPAPIP